MKVKSFSHVQLFGTPWTITYQAPLSMGFSRQEYWSGLPFPSPEVATFCLWGEDKYASNLCPSVSKMVFSSCFFQIFLYLIFCSLKIICLVVTFRHLSCLVFPKLPKFVVQCLTLIWANFNHCNFLYFFCSFFSFWYSHYIYVIPIVVAPQSLDVLFSSFQHLFSQFFILRIRILLIYL